MHTSHDPGEQSRRHLRPHPWPRPASIQEQDLTAGADAETLLLIPVKEDPEWVRLHQTAIDAAVAAGIRRIV